MTGAQPDRHGEAPGRPLPPHPVLRGHYAAPQHRSAYLLPLFDASSPHYDWVNHVLSLGTGVRYRRAALRRAGLAPGMQVLDVACGTGVLTEIARGVVGDRGSVRSVDPSEGMRREARRRRSIEALDATAEQLPFGEDSFDLLVMGYALRHVSDLGSAFAEFARVLRPGGRLLLLEITAPESNMARTLLRLYLRGAIPLITRLGSRNAAAQRLMVYHWDSIEHCVRPRTILDALAVAGFADCRQRLELGLFSEYTAIRTP